MPHAILIDDGFAVFGVSDRWRGVLTRSVTPMAAPSGKAVRVLVVDDEPDTADTLCLLLTMHGHDCRAAYDATAALELARSFSPRVALLDLGMADGPAWRQRGSGRSGKDA